MGKGAAHQLDENQHRCTPEEIWGPVQAFRPITLDPCSNEWATMPAKTRYVLPDRNGLVHPWMHVVKGPECVLVNPPWNKVLPWGVKAYKESQTRRDAHIFLLSGWDHSTRWHHYLHDHADAILLYRDRIDFPLKGIEGKPDRPCTCWYFGEATDEDLWHFEDQAMVLRPR